MYGENKNRYEEKKEHVSKTFNCNHCRTEVTTEDCRFGFSFYPYCGKDCCSRSLGDPAYNEGYEAAGKCNYATCRYREKCHGCNGYSHKIDCRSSIMECICDCKGTFPGEHSIGCLKTVLPSYMFNKGWEAHPRWFKKPVVTQVPCRYGKECYRTCSIHKAKYSH